MTRADRIDGGLMRPVLDGVRVIELAGIGPAPFCGMMLADRGGATADTLAALQAEAAARQAELVVLNYDGEGWEERFTEAFRDASASGKG